MVKAYLGGPRVVQIQLLPNVISFLGNKVAGKKLRTSLSKLVLSKPTKIEANVIQTVLPGGSNKLK